MVWRDIANKANIFLPWRATKTIPFRFVEPFGRSHTAPAMFAGTVAKPNPIFWAQGRMPIGATSPAPTAAVFLVFEGTCQHAGSHEREAMDAF
jgi:hypothetical protein